MSPAAHFPGNPSSESSFHTCNEGRVVAYTVDTNGPELTMEAFTFTVSTQVDFPIHVKMYVCLGSLYPTTIEQVG